MTKLLTGIISLFLTIILVGYMATSAQANGESIYFVQAGDTLFGIAARYGVSPGDLAAINGLNGQDWIQPGQQLIIPREGFGQPNQFDNQTVYPSPPPVPGSAGFYHPGQAQNRYEQRFTPSQQSPRSMPYSSPPPGFSASPQSSGFYAPPRPSSIPVRASMQPGMPAPYTRQTRERWIDVDLTHQSLTAYEGQTPVFRAIVSTGTWKYPTIAGTFEIYVKYEQAQMSGGYGEDAYDLANVPYVMYFHQGYGLHGTYWHNNFGTPMSHGCVNLSIPAAEWLFQWASVGTKVVTHY